MVEVALLGYYASAVLLIASMFGTLNDEKKF